MELISEIITTFVKHERTPERVTKLGIQMHVAVLSILNTISVLDNLGVARFRKAVHDWVQKADLQPVSDKPRIRSESPKR